MNKNKAYYINPDVFFFMENEKIYLWDYEHNTQFEIELDLFKTLSDISKDKEISSNNPYLKDLFEHDILRTSPYKTIEWGWDKLSYIFHKGTQNIPELKDIRTKKEMIDDFIGFSETYLESIQQNYFKKLSLPPKPEKKYIKTVLLPKDHKNLEQISLKNALRNRLTARDFQGKFISKQDLSSILFYTFGNVHEKWEGVDPDIALIGIRKTSPSAGGIHSIKAYVVIWSVEGISQGLYLYDFDNHALKLIHTKVDSDIVVRIISDQYFIKGLSFGVFLVSDLNKVWEKYLHSRVYRDIYLDAGHVSQTLQLLSSGLDLNVWCSGYFRDNLLLDFLNLKESENQAPLFFVGAGHSEGGSLNPDLLKILRET